MYHYSHTTHWPFLVQSEFSFKVQRWWWLHHHPIEAEREVKFALARKLSIVNHKLMGHRNVTRYFSTVLRKQTEN